MLLAGFEGCPEVRFWEGTANRLRCYQPRLIPSGELLFPYRIGEELPTKRPLCETWARMSHLDPNDAPDRRPITVGEVWENPVTGERSVTWSVPGTTLLAA